MSASPPDTIHKSSSLRRTSSTCLIIGSPLYDRDASSIACVPRCSHFDYFSLHSLSYIDYTCIKCYILFSPSLSILPGILYFNRYCINAASLTFKPATAGGEGDDRDPPRGMIGRFFSSVWKALLKTVAVTVKANKKDKADEVTRKNSDNVNGA